MEKFRNTGAQNARSEEEARPVWVYHNPVTVHFGAGSLGLVAGLVGSRPYGVVTYGEPLFRALRTRIADAAGPPVLVIDTVTPNPDFLALDRAAAAWAKAPVRPEAIVALGGGSVMDSAKALAAADGDFGRVQRFLETGQGADRLKSVPLVCVPTTAGTGSEVTMWAALWDTVSGRKYSLARPNLYPEHAVIDPALMLGAPRGLTVAAGLDALSHALESIWNRNANPVSTHYATVAAAELMAALPLVLDDPGSLALRTRVARSALFAGLAFSNTKTALAHSLSYPITLKHGTPHGIACSFSLPMVMRSVIGENAACDQALARIFGADLEAGARHLSEFLVGLGVAVDPADYGLDDGEWRKLIDHALDGERGRNFIAPRERVVESLRIRNRRPAESPSGA